MKAPALLFFFAFTISGLLMIQARTPLLLEDACTSDSSCPSGHCCSLGGERYSTPRCNPMRKEGDVCKRDQTIDSVLNYPDGSMLEVFGVHMILCPCDSGLTCETVSDGESTCKRQ